VRCPECDGATIVKDSRKRKEYIYRRRECGCGVRFSTKEVVFGIQLPPESEIARLDELSKLIASQINDANQSLRGRIVRGGGNASARATKSLDYTNSHGRTLHDRMSG
jgi:hypothetical protein